MTPLLSEHEVFETLTAEALRSCPWIGLRAVRTARNQAAGTPRQPRKPGYRAMDGWRESGLIVR